MIEYNNLQNPLIQLPICKYESFYQHLQSITTVSTLDIFKEQYICDLITKISTDLFDEEIKHIIYLLNETNTGIAALDIPEIISSNPALNAVCGAAIIIGIFNNIGISNFDYINSTPFTLHTASHNHGEILQSAGYTSDAKMGFHNDGLLRSGNLEIPKHIAIYNMYLGYRRPGMFQWIPSSLWKEKDTFGKNIKSEDIRIKIELTPYFYLNNEGSFKKRGFSTIEIPISSINSAGERRFFLNGKVLQENNYQENIELIKKIRDSLQDNPIKISIPQKERRAFYLKNTMGFHARDIFQDAIDGVDLTRAYLRVVDINSEIYPSINNAIDEIIN